MEIFKTDDGHEVMFIHDDETWDGIAKFMVGHWSKKDIEDLIFFLQEHLSSVYKVED